MPLLAPKRRSEPSVTRPTIPPSESASNGCSPVPARTYYGTWLRWINRFNADPETFTSEALKRESELLGAEIAAMKRDRSEGDRGVLERREAQQAAIAWALDSRARAERSTAPRAKAAAPPRVMALGAGCISKPSDDTPSAAPDYDPSVDPFDGA